MGAGVGFINLDNVPPNAFPECPITLDTAENAGLRPFPTNPPTREVAVDAVFATDPIVVDANEPTLLIVEDATLDTTPNAVAPNFATPDNAPPIAENRPPDSFFYDVAC